MAQLRGDESKKQEPLLQEILALGKNTLSPNDYQNLESILNDETTKIQFILSNIDEYEKVACTKYITLGTNKFL